MQRAAVATCIPSRHALSLPNAGAGQTRPDQTRLGLFDRQTDANQTGQGIVYFASHRALWKPFLSRVAPTLAVSAAVTVPMFIFTYLPQLAVLVWVNGPLAMFTTVLLVLNESSTITSMIARNFIMQDALLDTFDATLVSRGATAAVKEGRELQPGSDPVGKLGKVLMSPFERFSPNAIVRYLIHLPLNFIPGKPVCLAFRQAACILLVTPSMQS